MMLRVIDREDGRHLDPVYNLEDDVSELDEFCYSITSTKRISEGIKGKQPKVVKYLEIPCAFDIETTNMSPDEKHEKPWAYMYQWQFCIRDKVFFGRTWNEFRRLLQELEDRLYLSDKRRLVIYVHNLAFEFQFMRFFADWSEVFCKAERHPIKALANGCIEFRCSYALSNMTLKKFCENTPGCLYQKNDGDIYDYNKLRTAKYKLTPEEISYCYCDVRGLCECIRHLMKEDTLARIPMTSTGYVRRDFRESYKKNRKLREQWQLTRLSAETYTVCRNAFRGGDTHASYWYSGIVLHDIQSWDLSSSYPAAMLLDKYPVGKFTEIKPETWVKHDCMPGYAAILYITFANLEYTGAAGMPYIPVDIAARRGYCSPWRINDNGRILKCTEHYNEETEEMDPGLVSVWITDVDYKIIAQEYTWTRRWIKKVYVAAYGDLPEEHKSQVMEYFRRKTQLKNVPGKEYEYMKSKNRLNSSYGMMVQNVAKPEWVYEDGIYQKKEKDLAEILDKYYHSRNNFLRYDVGIFVTANARARLHLGIQAVGADCVYVDTDSIKCRHDHSDWFEAYNKMIMDRCNEAGYYAEDPSGERHYLGCWEHEADYSEWKDLGSKRYIVKIKGQEDRGYLTTIAGVNKKRGAAFFNEVGLDYFEDGCVIKNAGHTVAYYNDDKPHFEKVDGCIFESGSNVALVDDVYTLGLTGEYKDLLNKYLAGQRNIV